MVFRKATIKDIDAINSLFYELDTDAINLHPDHFQRGSRSFEYLSGIINDDKSDFILAIIDDDIVGFSLLFERATPDVSVLVPCKFAYLQDFIVTEGCRNKGVGAALMEQSKQWARERKMDYLRLSVLAGNKNAQRFYARHGLTEHMLTMECSLHAWIM